MNDVIKKFLSPLASLKLTVFLLSIAMVVVFTGTSAQKEHGIQTVLQDYFHTFLAWVPLKYFFPLSHWGWENVKGVIPLPGGYTLILALLVNLLAAHAVRFKVTWKRSGILLIHAGLILLLGGEVVTSLFAVESQMPIEEGQSISWSQDIRTCELAVIDPSDPARDMVTVVPASLLRRGGTIRNPQLPFDVKVEKFYPNSALVGPFQARQLGKTNEVELTAGAGRDMQLTVIEQPHVTGVNADEIDVPSTLVTLSKDGVSLGTWVFSLYLDPQPIDVMGKPYQVALRWKRLYKPYSLELIDFKFDRYTGTDVAKNFSSLVRLRDPARGEDREVLIWMNHPLRYAGETFFQSGWNRQTEKGTVLSVVRNPGWTIPYISCTLVGVGLLVHFGMHLLQFMKREGGTAGARDRHKPSRGPTGGVLWPGIVTAACAVFILGVGRPRKTDVPFDLNLFGRIPVSYEGRVMPLDSLAENSLRSISGKSTIELNGKREPAIRWFIENLANPDESEKLPIIRIDNPDVLGVLKLNPNEKRFSFAQILPQRAVLVEQADRAHKVRSNERDLYQRKILEAWEQFHLTETLIRMPATLYMAPPQKPGDDWKRLDVVMNEAQSGAAANPALAALPDIVAAYKDNKPELFNSLCGEYLNLVESRLKSVSNRVTVETVFNRFSPFYYSMFLYVLVFLLVCASWFFGGATLRRAAYWVLLLTLVFHTMALAGRIYISGRPPVTNLYSSAIFIAWGAVVFCAILERFFRNGMGTLVASIVAAPSLIVAHYLAAGEGDTMKMLQAVLDTNFWLATHVVIVTLGYAATFLAGMIGVVYVLGTVFTRAINDERRRNLTRMAYGTICFAMLFSFVGTILGGIWADQSWGRFWGWDPKENGAVLIVMWNAVILHARWGGMIRERGMMNLAIFGNIVTSWSWFGTNMMGVGLHAYGFIDSAVMWLSIVDGLMLAIIALGLLPQGSRSEVPEAHDSPAPRQVARKPVRV